MRQHNTNILLTKKVDGVEGFTDSKFLRQALCQVCLKHEFQYTCPRCEMVYCSTACYKAHSDSCTEAFFRSQVKDALEAQKPTESEKQHMEKKLAMLYANWESEPNEIDLNDEDFLEEHNIGEDDDSSLGSNDNGDQDIIDQARINELKELANADSLTIDHLTEKETRMFHSSLKRGRLDNVSIEWTPWWLKTEIISFPIDPITHICCSSTKSVNYRVAYGCLDVMYAYIRIMRIYNGVIESEDIFEAIEDINQIAMNVFKSNSILPSTISESILSMLEHVTKVSQNKQTQEFNVLCYKDVIVILSSQWKTIAIFEAILLLFHQAIQQMKHKQYRYQMKMTEKKLLFYYSFCKYHLYNTDYLLKLHLTSSHTTVHSTHPLKDNQHIQDTLEKTVLDVPNVPFYHCLQEMDHDEIISCNLGTLIKNELTIFIDAHWKRLFKK